MPKRKFEESASDGCLESAESEESCSSLNTNGSTDVPSSSTQGPFTKLKSAKKQKKSVSFDGVTVFYFPRKQGFTCVPSQGGSTLGMSEKHEDIEKFTLTEYTKHQRRYHHQILLDQHKQGKIILPPDKLIISKLQSSSGDSANSSENEPASSDSDDDDFNIDDYYFLQPVTTKQRRVLLRQSGIKKIEPVEKEECKDIRSSREICGCNCKGFCNPDTCICSQAGIKCQVDRLSFPCGCSKDGCGNVHGRIEFNPIRVRTHFIHTLMRLEMEKSSDWDKGKASKSMKTAVDTVSSSHIVDNDNQNVIEKTEGKTEPVEKPVKIDLAKFNSNELGSCRDCQSSEISDIIMRESNYSASNQEKDSCMQSQMPNFAMNEEAQMGLPNVAIPSESLPQVMLFSDDEEGYHAENTTTMFHFPKEESSYSESSDCSSEGSTTVEEQAPFQPSYPTYNNYEVVNSKINPSSTTELSEFVENVIDAPVVTTLESSECGPSTVQSEHNFNSTSNSYKLEPISEILNPLRYPEYIAKNETDSCHRWNGDYCDFAKGESVATPILADKTACDEANQTQPMKSNGKNCEKKKKNFTNGVTSTTAFDGRSSYMNSNAFVDGTNHARVTRSTSAAEKGVRDLKPSLKYTELKPSPQHSVQGNLASFYSTANQVTGSFDPSNQNVTSTVPSLHLSTTSTPPVTVDSVNPTSTSDLFSLLPAQTVQPVTTFDLPSEEQESESFEKPESQSSSPAGEPNPGTQNFGEIIKESIVETVSA